MKLRRFRAQEASAVPCSAPGTLPEQRMLTSPMNQVSLLAQTDLQQPQTQPGAGFFSRTNRRPASLQELDEQVADLRQELRFSSSVPISHWIRCADVLKRRADQHHHASDLEGQYLWYVGRML